MYLDFELWNVLHQAIYKKYIQLNYYDTEGYAMTI